MSYHKCSSSFHPIIPVMVLSKVIPYVQIQLRILDLLGMCPFKYNAETRRFQKCLYVTPRSSALIHTKVISIIIFVLFTTANGIYHLNFLSEFEEEQLGLNNVTYKMFVLFFTIVFLAVTVTCSPLVLLTDDIVGALNFMLDFETSRTSERSNGTRIVKILLVSFTQLSITAPFSVTIFNVFQPSLLPFLGSILPGLNFQVKTWTWVELGVKCVTVLLHVVVMFYQTWFYVVLATGSFLMVGHIFMVLAFSLHNGLTVMKRESRRELLSLLQEYRKLSILEIKMNSCFRRTFLPSAFLYICILNIFGMVLTVSIFHDKWIPSFSNAGHHGEAHFGKFLFPLIAIQGYVAILALGSVAGKVNKTSKVLLTQLKKAHYNTGHKSKEFLTLLHSCAPIKVRFANNFVEISTPLTMLCFCLKVTVRVLLIT